MNGEPDGPRLFLIDGSALAYRSFFGLGRTSLSTSRGEPTGAVFGFANTLWSLLRDYRPEYMAVVFDTPEPTFRHREYEAYKAHREAMPEDLVQQLPRLEQLVRAWPLELLAGHGVEADDIMGSYAVQVAGPDLHVVLVSGDKDFCQLIGPHVSLLNPGRGGPSKVDASWLDAEGVRARFGVPPSKVVDVLALMGDSSDNVPGVPGIGEKTAAALIQEFGDLDALYRSLDRVEKKSLQEKLRGHEDLARLSRRLVTIKTDLPLPASTNALRVGPPSRTLVDFFREMQFGRLSREAEAALGPATPPPAGGTAASDAGSAPGGEVSRGNLNLFDDATTGSGEPRRKGEPSWRTELPGTDAEYRVVADEPALAGLVEQLFRLRSGFAIDTETTGVDPMTASLVGISLGLGAQRAVYIPVAHEEGPNLSLSTVRRLLGPALLDSTFPKFGHHLKYDLVVLERAGLPVAGDSFDTMIASYLIDAERSHKLDNLALDILDYTMIPISELIGKGAQQRSFALVPVPLACRYSAEDADITYRLVEKLRPELERRDLESLFENVEMPLMHVLMEMEQTGVALDVSFLSAMSVRLGAEMVRLEALAHDAAGEAFNLNSPAQLGRILFEKLKLPVARKTKTGYSTDSEVLEDLVPQHPLPRLVLDYRQLTKLKSTYVDALPRLIHPDTGRLHTSFNQTVAATGRLSSSDPNLQNIPIRTPLGREVRRAFVAGGEDLVLLSADYSQIELRIMAHLSRDERLTDFLRRGIDVHRETAASIFGVPPDAVTAEQRSRAKTVNFGIMYGQGPTGLARQIGITRPEAAAFIEAYRAQFPGVSEFLERTIREASQSGFVTTLLKRRRYLPNLKSSNGRLKAEAERMAINTPIQGTAADLIKVAMIAVNRELKAREPRARLLLQVHDELVLEAPAVDAPAVADLVRRAMEGALSLDVPVVVEVGTGRDWASIH